MSDPNSTSRPVPDELEVGILAIEDIPEGALRAVDPVEGGGMPPLDEPQGVEDWGTTAAEHQGDEPLSVRAQREEPDVLEDLDEGGGDTGGGGTGSGRVDTLSAEEAAMRVEEEPAGMNYDPDPGYLNED